LRPKAVSLADDAWQTVVWRLGRRASGRYGRLLSRGRRVKVRFSSTVTDLSGNASTPVERVIRLLPRVPSA
jgi:hypothetical protein